MEIARCKSEKRTPAGASGGEQDGAERHWRRSKTGSLTSFPTVEHRCAISVRLSQARKARASALSLPFVRRRRIFGWNGSSRPMLGIGKTPDGPRGGRAGPFTDGGYQRRLHAIALRRALFRPYQNSGFVTPARQHRPLHHRSMARHRRQADRLSADLPANLRFGRAVIHGYHRSRFAADAVSLQSEDGRPEHYA
jgi:hypothetical protein